MTRTCGASILIVFLSAAQAAAQGDPPVGVRAAGMGGAFTAVADDATAAVWNPAGLASGSYFGVSADRNSFDRQSALFTGVGTPPLALTYTRTAIADVPNNRDSLVAHNFGVTFVQSLGDTGVAVGTTLRVVHGVVSANDSSASTTRFDADIGVMASGGLGKIGLTVHNLVRPNFTVPGSGSRTIRLDRRVRGGVSLHLNERTLVAADAEFTTSATWGVPWRDAAVGVEAQPVSHAWIRGGVHWNTAGGGAGGTGAAPIATVGASYAIRGSLVLDGQGSFGSARGNRGWGIGLRFVF
jgi:hypothetical protein